MGCAAWREFIWIGTLSSASVDVGTSGAPPSACALFIAGFTGLTVGLVNTHVSGLSWFCPGSVPTISHCALLHTFAVTLGCSQYVYLPIPVVIQAPRKVCASGCLSKC
jgi:hypothetical protein